MTEKHQPTGKNTNCLDGMCCPDCGNEDELLIAATMLVSVKDDGTDPYARSVRDYSQDWDDNSACECPECQHVGTVGEFKGKDPEDLLAEWQWDGRTVRDIEKRIEAINHIVPQKTKEWAYTVPDDCRGKFSYVALTNPVNSLDEVHKSIEILAVDRAGEALVCRGTIHTYLDAEGEDYSVMPVGEAKSLFSQYKPALPCESENSEAVSVRRDDAEDLAGALDSCLTQIYQMKGMFGDEDRAIQNAIDDAELALQYHRTSPSISKDAAIDLTPYGSLSNMMDYILEHEGESFSEELKSAGECFAPVGITEDEWNEAIMKHEELIDQLARAKTREDSDKIEGQANELFDHIARHTDGHIYCDAVRVREVIRGQKTALRDEQSTAYGPRG